MYGITYSVYYIGVNDYKELGIEREKYFLILDVITYFPYIIFLLFSVVFVINNKKIFILKKENFVKKVITIIGIIYLVLFILDPFYHNFKTDNIPVFELKKISFDGFFLEILPVITIIPVFEEFFFRSVLLKPFIKEKLFLFGIIITSLLYAVSHFYITNNHFSLDFLAFINYFFVGVVFSSLSIKYGLFYAILTHFFYNLLIFISNKIINLYLLDYIKSNTLYWSVYSFIILLILYAIYNFFKNTINKSNW